MRPRWYYQTSFNVCINQDLCLWDGDEAISFGVPLPPPSIHPRWLLCTTILEYRGTSLIRTRVPLGPYSRHMSSSYGAPRGWAVSYERGTPVPTVPTPCRANGRATLRQARATPRRGPKPKGPKGASAGHRPHTCCPIANTPRFLRCSLSLSLSLSQMSEGVSRELRSSLSLSLSLSRVGADPLP